MRTLLKLVVAVGLLIWGLNACDIIDLPGASPGETEPPAAKMMPTLPGYKTVEGQTLTAYLGQAATSNLLAEKPELAAAVAKVDQVIGCYQEVGAARARIYSNEAKPWSVGAVAIADRNALLSPANLFKCVGGSQGRQVQSQDAAAVKPCSANYTLSKDNDEFYVIYVGTTPEICREFCANLEGCTAH